MFDAETEFAYWSRRSAQEEVAAINARHVEAAAAHQRLSGLHATRALLALADMDGPVVTQAGRC